MNFKKNELIFIPIGGSEEIGMNANLYHYNDRWILIDLGISFPDETDIGVDIILPDYEFIKNLKNKLSGIFLTHAHEDHYGAIIYYAKEIECPVWGTEFTLALLRRKFKENGLKFNFEMKTIPKTKNIKVADFNIEVIKASHSIPQPLSFLIQTNGGNVFHTGDWKSELSENLNEIDYFTSLKKISKKNISSIVSDSTNSLVGGRTPSENFAYLGLMKIIKKRKGCVLITCFSSNISRIKSIITIAEKLKKKILIIGRSLNRSVDAAIETGIINNINSILEINYKNKKENLNNTLIICTGSQGEQNSALSRISRSKHDKISLGEGDTVIFSSRKIPGNEKAILKLENRFIDKGVEVLTDEENDVHVSGHPSKDELIEMYNLLNPKSVIPVHGNSKQLKANAEIAKSCQIENVVIPKNGNIINISSKKVKEIGRIDTNTKTYDNGYVIPLNDERFVVRKHALWNGFISVSIVLNDQGEMLSVPKLSQNGICENIKMRNTLLEISLKIEDFIEGIVKTKVFDDDYLNIEIKKIIKKEMKTIFSVRPITNVHINRIQ